MRRRVVHPPWCWGDRCTAVYPTGEHRSRSLRLPAAGGPVSSVVTLTAGRVSATFAEITLSVRLTGATGEQVATVQRLLRAIESTIRKEIDR